MHQLCMCAQSQVNRNPLSERHRSCGLVFVTVTGPEWDLWRWLTLGRQIVPILPAAWEAASSMGDYLHSRQWPDGRSGRANVLIPPPPPPPPAAPFCLINLLFFIWLLLQLPHSRVCMCVRACVLARAYFGESKSVLRLCLCLVHEISTSKSLGVLCPANQ